MKQKILEALQQGRSNLGLSVEVFERVAASIETFVATEEDIDKYVNSELVNNLLKFEQADADRKRSKKAKSEGDKPKQKDNDNPDTNATQDDKPNIAEIVAQAVASAITPLQEELTAFKTAQAQKGAMAALDELKNTWDYAKGYPAECADAYEQTVELYEVGGKKWNAEELTAKFTEKFNKAVSRKGVDTSKPFQSDGGGDKKPDFSGELELLKSEGIELS